MSTSIKDVLEHFFASSHRFPDIKYYIIARKFNLDIIPQGQNAQYSQLHHWMAGISLRQSYTQAFLLALTVFKILNVI